jgi:hypothetical protein
MHLAIPHVRGVSVVPAISPQDGAEATLSFESSATLLMAASIEAQRRGASWAHLQPIRVVTPHE